MIERVKNGNKKILQGCVNDCWEKNANIGRRGGFFLWSIGSPYMISNQIILIPGSKLNFIYDEK